MITMIGLYILGGLSVLGGLFMLLSKHPIRCAVSLLFVMILLAMMYALLSAPFIAVLQIIIYAGAIMTLIVFVVTLVDVKGDDLHKMFSQAAFWAIPTALVLLLVVALQVISAAVPVQGVPADFGSVKKISQALMSNYLLPFELASVLLLVGIVGISALKQKKEGK